MHREQLAAISVVTVLIYDTAPARIAKYEAHYRARASLAMKPHLLDSPMENHPGKQGLDVDDKAEYPLPKSSKPRKCSSLRYPLEAAIKSPTRYLHQIFRKNLCGKKNNRLIGMIGLPGRKSNTNLPFVKLSQSKLSHPDPERNLSEPNIRNDSGLHIAVLYAQYFIPNH